MALQAKLMSINYTINTRNAQGQTQIVDHSHSGQLVADVDYVDSAAPNTVLFSHTFNFNHTDTDTTMLQRINDAGFATFHARQLVSSFKPLEGTVVVAEVVAPTAPPVEPGA